MENIREIKTLDEFIRSEYFMAWDESNRSPGGCGIIMSDSERWDRIQEAAENGAEGSTHYEIIQDWRDAFRAFRRDDRRHEDTEEEEDAREAELDAIEAEIEACYVYHRDHGTLDQEVG